MNHEFSVNDLQELYPDYNITEYIDSGGSKDVFLGSLDGEDVVIKILPVESRHRLRRAEREARAMEIIDSDIFVNLREHFVDEIPDLDLTVFVIVEEYVEGETLRTVIDQTGGYQSLGVDVLSSLLKVLQEFDDHDIIHRDINPSNIMVSPDRETIRLLDVGIARFTKKRSLTATSDEYGPGTRGYRAPEQIENRKHEQDIRTDLFSTGIVMYESITGRHPFDFGQEDISTEILAGNRRPSDDIEDEGLRPIFERLTANELHERYRKPQFALQELEFVMEGSDDV